MAGSWRIAVLAWAAALLTGVAYGKGRNDAGAEAMLRIHVYDGANLPGRVLQAATDEASRLFRAAGIGIVWDQGTAESEESRQIDMSSASAPRGEAVRDLVVRLDGKTPGNLFPGALGFALPFAQKGVQAWIFCDRAEAVSRGLDMALGVVLGYAMAHEIGHVLLRSSEHASAGLMQANWKASIWRLASAGLIAFGNDEAERMRAGAWRFQARR